MLVLVALIIRGVSFEWRARVDTPRWRGTWSWTLTVGSALVPLLLGVALGDLLVGLPIAASNEFTGTFWSLLTPYGLWLGLTLLVLCLLHGATFLGLKAGGGAPGALRAAGWAPELAVAASGGGLRRVDRLDLRWWTLAGHRGRRARNRRGRGHAAHPGRV